MIKNAIDVKEYFFDFKKRELLREELGISNEECVIGHIGRISYQKNQKFILLVFRELLKRRSNDKLLLIGGGDDSELKKLASDYGIKDNIRFLGLKNNVKDYYSVFDVFFFPSNYEGLPVTLLEAQANGIPILTSSEISKQVIVNNNLEMHSLTLNVESWADKLKNIIEKGSRVDREVIENNFFEKGFEINREAKNLENILMEE